MHRLEYDLFTLVGELKILLASSRQALTNPHAKDT